MKRVMKLKGMVKIIIKKIISMCMIFILIINTGCAVLPVKNDEKSDFEKDADNTVKILSQKPLSCTMMVLGLTAGLCISFIVCLNTVKKLWSDPVYGALGGYFGLPIIIGGSLLGGAIGGLGMGWLGKVIEDNFISEPPAGKPMTGINGAAVKAQNQKKKADALFWDYKKIDWGTNSLPAKK
jgi:hypothetical protein